MASLLYKDFLIVAGADFETLTRSWVSIVSVSWNAGGKQEIHFLSQTGFRRFTILAAMENCVCFAYMGRSPFEKQLSRMHRVGRPR